MELIKQYVDLLVKRNEESLEFKRVHSEWELTQTEDARELVNKAKIKIDATEKEIKKLYSILKDKGIAVGGEEPWGTEMRRYEYWLIENHVTAVRDADPQSEIVKQYVDLLIKRKKEFLEYQKLMDEWKALEDKINDIMIRAEQAKEKFENTKSEAGQMYDLIKERGLITKDECAWEKEMTRYTNWLNEYSLIDAN